MRLFKEMPTLAGAWGFMAFWSGLAMALIAVGLFIRLDIHWTGLTVVQGLGGRVEVVEGVYLPEMVVRTGGAVGLLVGWALGFVSTVAQSIFWLTDYKLKDQKPMTRLIMRSVLVFNVFSSVYVLSGGTQILGFILADPVQWLARFVVSVGVTLLAIGIGGEVWLAFGLELMKANVQIGLGAFGRGGKRLADGFTHLMESIEGYNEEDDEGEPVSGWPTQPRPEGRTGRPGTYRPQHPPIDRSGLGGGG